jgi:AcrR family transcriptional regulator
MPRPADPLLEERILDAAQELWIAGGEDALSMRAIADRLGIHTPRIYSRFSAKEQLLRALRSRVVTRLGQSLAASTSLRDGLRRYLDFARDRPFEYRLLFGPGFQQRMTPGERGPLLVLQSALARTYGGDPASHRLRALSIWALLHGAATLQVEFGDEERRNVFRNACLDACERIAAGDVAPPRAVTAPLVSLPRAEW